MRYSKNKVDSDILFDEQIRSLFSHFKENSSDLCISIFEA